MAPRHSFPHLIASGDGTLVNLFSLFGLVPVPSQSAYVAAEYAVRGFTESVRIEMLAAGHAVRVTCVHPGGVQIAITRNGTSNAAADPAGNCRILRQHAGQDDDPRTGCRADPARLGRGPAQVLIGADAWILYLLGSVNNRCWQRMAAFVFRRLDRFTRTRTSSADGAGG